jgi:aldehyde dehydrogenase (NAD+)
MGEVPDGNAADAEAAVKSATTAFKTWSATTAAQREEIMLRWADAMAKHESNLANILVEESGSVILKATFEARYCVQLLRFAAGECRRLYGKPNIN